MRQWTVFVPVCAALLACALPGCGSSTSTASGSSAVQFPAWAGVEESATIVGKLTNSNGDPFTERITAIVKQGTASKSMTVENGEYRIPGLLAGTKCSLEFTSKDYQSIGKAGEIELKGGENPVNYVVEILPGGKYRLLPGINIPPNIGTGPTK